MVVPTPIQSTLDDLYNTEGKAELIGGRIVHLMPAGRTPNRVAFKIARSLDDHAEQAGVGEAYSDNMGFALQKPAPSGRQSFSPGASYYAGPFPPNPMRFIEGPPTFAVEVRSENDYGPAAERDMEEKRADYFAAGTGVVWDVDPRKETVIKYVSADPNRTIIFHRGDVTDAEPAVPGWRMTVDAIFG